MPTELNRTLKWNIGKVVKLYCCHWILLSFEFDSFFFSFFYNTQTYNNTSTPKLLATVRVVELLIYPRTPSKLGNVGQSPHTSFFLITQTYNTLTPKLLAAVRVGSCWLTTLFDGLMHRHLDQSCWKEEGIVATLQCKKYNFFFSLPIDYYYYYYYYYYYKNTNFKF